MYSVHKAQGFALGDFYCILDVQSMFFVLTFVAVIITLVLDLGGVALVVCVVIELSPQLFITCWNFVWK